VRYGKYNVLESTIPNPSVAKTCVECYEFWKATVCYEEREILVIRVRRVPNRSGHLLAALTVCEGVKYFMQFLRSFHRIVPCACVMGRKSVRVYLLSDHVRIMACFNFERAIVCPQVHGVCNTGYAAFENLRRLAATTIRSRATHHLGCFSAGN